MDNYEYCNEPSYDTSTNRQQVVGMAYVPVQQWYCPIPLEEGFYKGTIFYDLDKPFQP